MAIIRDQDVRSGKPVVEGTRVTVSDVSEAFHNLGRSVSEVSEDYGVTEEEVEEALRYAKSRQSGSVKA